MKVATAQISPVYFDVEATLNKMEKYTIEAAQKGAQLIVFPECMIAMYPNWTPDPYHPENKGFYDYYRKFCEAAVEIPGAVTEFLERVAYENQITIVTGVVERDTQQKGTFYNSSIVIGADGKLIGHHRKTTPVNHEKHYFALGGVEDVKVFDSNVGKLGIGICYENRNPLYEYALGSAGEQIHCALWVSPGSMADSFEDKDLNTFQMIEHLAAAYASVNGVYVIASAIVTKEEENQPIKATWYHAGASFIMAPDMRILAKVDLHTEGIAVAEIDPVVLDTCRIEWNPYGKEARNDIFKFELKKEEEK